jgi:KDO2-lipid IV(A) lauroyltransferase
MPSTQPAKPSGREKSRRKPALRRGAERLATRLVVSAFACVIRWLPLSWGRRLANVFGYVFQAATLRRQRLADRNLAATFGDRLSPRERRRIRLAVSRNMCKVFVELFKTSRFTPSQIRDLVPLENPEILREALARGNGAMVITGHFGNWELLGARLAAEGFNLAVVARDASDAGVASLINQSRESVGMSVFGKKDLKGMNAHLRANGVLGILPDQHARKGSILLDFLGRPAWVIRSPALLALRTGAAIVPAFCLREPDDSLRALILPEIPTSSASSSAVPAVDVAVPSTQHPSPVTAVTLTKRINAVLEQQILAHPDQWLWLHNRWKPAAPEHEEKYLRKADADGDDDP